MEAAAAKNQSRRSNHVSNSNHEMGDLYEQPLNRASSLDVVGLPLARQLQMQAEDERARKRLEAERERQEERNMQVVMICRLLPPNLVLNSVPLNFYSILFFASLSLYFPFNWLLSFHLVHHHDLPARPPFSLCRLPSLFYFTLTRVMSPLIIIPLEAVKRTTFLTNNNNPCPPVVPRPLSTPDGLLRRRQSFKRPPDPTRRRRPFQRHGGSRQQGGWECVWLRRR